MTLAAVASFSVGRASRSSMVTRKVSLILANTDARHPTCELGRRAVDASGLADYSTDVHLHHFFANEPGRARISARAASPGKASLSMSKLPAGVSPPQTLNDLCFGHGQSRGSLPLPRERSTPKPLNPDGGSIPAGGS